MTVTDANRPTSSAASWYARLAATAAELNGAVELYASVEALLAGHAPNPADLALTARVSDFATAR